MKYFSEQKDFVNAECEVCERILKIKKLYCHCTDNGFDLKPPIKCICGNVSNEIKVEGKRQDNINYVKDDAVRCPKCSSIQITAQKQGFGLGKAVVGGVLTGGVGLLAGFIGSKKIIITCLKCGHKWTVIGR